jgi:hypothetical protein
MLAATSPDWRLIMRRLGIALVAFAAALALGIAAGPARAVTVTVVPADTTVAVGSTFTLRVVTDAFPDLKAFHLYYGFASAKITCSSVSPGDVLTSSGNTYSLFPAIDNTVPNGTVLGDGAMLAGSSSGPGILMFVTFHAVAAGDSPITCLPTDQQGLATPNFRDSNNTQTLPACVSGIVHVGGPTSVQPATWGRLKSFYR